MSYTFEKIINTVVEPYLSRQLVSCENWTQINKIAKILSDAFSSSFIFECRLAERNPRADFSVCATASDGGREILAGYNSAINLSEGTIKNTVWNQINHFILCWANTKSSFYENVENIWLEFDVDGLSSNVPAPSFFFSCINIRPELTITCESKHYGKRYTWVQDALKILLDKSISSEIKQKLFDCFNLLPTDAELLYTGIMLARKTEAIRICIGKMSAVQIIEYLKSIDWKGSIDEIENTISEISSLVDVIVLDLDIGEIVYPKIGLECGFNAEAPYKQKLQKFLDYLVEKRLCLPAKRDAIIAFRGYSHEMTNPDFWPSDFSEVSTFMGKRVLSAFVRRLNHIKIVYQPGINLEAKAYLSVDHSWIPSSLLQQKEKNIQ